MDFAPLVPWLSLVALVISVGTSVTTFLTSGAKANASRISDHEKRIQAMEGELRHLPDKDAVHRLELSLAGLQVEIVKIGASAEQSARTSARVEQYLMEKA